MRILSQGVYYGIGSTAASEYPGQPTTNCRSAGKALRQWMIQTGLWRGTWLRLGHVRSPSRYYFDSRSGPAPLEVLVLFQQTRSTFVLDYSRYSMEFSV